MITARYLADTSAIVRLLADHQDRHGFDQALTAGLVAIGDLTELELLYAARSASDRAALLTVLRDLYTWCPTPDRAFERARQVQTELTTRGQHRSAGPVDLLVAATAELSGLTLLHCDRDFETIATVTGQSTRTLVDRPSH